MRLMMGKRQDFSGNRVPSFFCPFCLTKKDQKVKADITGPPHKAGASPPCRPWPAHPTRTSIDNPTQKAFLWTLPGLRPHCRFASSRGTKRSINERFVLDLTLNSKLHLWEVRTAEPRRKVSDKKLLWSKESGKPLKDSP